MIKLYIDQYIVYVRLLMEKKPLLHFQNENYSLGL